MKERFELFVKKLLSIKILVGLPLLTVLFIFKFLPWEAWLIGFSGIFLSRETTKIFLEHFKKKNENQGE